MMRKSLTSLLFVGALSAGLMHAASPASSIVDAASQGNRDAVRTFLKDGADVNTSQPDGMTSLHWAAQKGDIELAKTLLYAGANLKATTRIGGYTPLLIASRIGNAAMIETLASGGADANVATTSGTTALMFASQAGNADAVSALITHGANVKTGFSNSPRSTGITSAWCRTCSTS